MWPQNWGLDFRYMLDFGCLRPHSATHIMVVSFITNPELSNLNRCFYIKNQNKILQ
jgi:hypothetical protein